MPTAQSVHGIANGRWEPTPPRSSKAVTVARIGVAKILKNLSDRLAGPAELAREEQPANENHGRAAAE
jgi:hypothetical protein